MTANNNESITNDNEWYNKWQRGENEQQQVTTNDNEWQRVVIPTNFPFFRATEEPTTKQPKESSLNLKELRAKKKP